MQWKLPSTISSFVQRAGRAARGHDRTGLAVLLVEKAAYEVDLSKVKEVMQGGSKKKNIRKSSDYPKATKAYAIEHGVLRGAYGGKTDDNLVKERVPLDQESADEGLYTFVQTGICRRLILMEIYGNELPSEYHLNQ